MEVWEKERRKKLKGSAAFARACVRACGRVGLSALTHWGEGGEGRGGCCGNGGKLTLTLNNGIKEADI